VRVNFDVLFDSKEIELPGEIVLKKAESSKKVNLDNTVEFALEVRQIKC
jgi:hypothetical protein